MDTNNKIFIKINILPEDMVNIIKEYLPKIYFIFTNRENYTLYHPIIKLRITKYENYIRDIIIRDNDFVFDKIVKENYKKWIENKNYIYKHLVFKNYIYFINHFCIEMKSHKCKTYFSHFINELGLCKNQHKKNIIKHIIWKN